MQKKRKEKKWAQVWMCFIGETRNRHTKCSWGGDHSRLQTGACQERSGDDPAALLPTAWCQRQQQKPFLCQLWVQEEVKEDTIHHMAWSEKIEKSLDLIVPKSRWNLVLAHCIWMDSWSRWAWWPRGHFCWLLEVDIHRVDMDEVDMAPHLLEEWARPHGTSVGTLLENGWQGFHWWFYWYDVDVDADGGERMQMVNVFLGLKESPKKYKQTTFLITESPIVRISSRANNCPISKDSIDP